MYLAPTIKIKKRKNLYFIYTVVKTIVDVS